MEQDINQIEFDINQIPEPENISDVIYSLMVNPNITPLNYFNDFTEDSEDLDDSGIFELEDGTKLLTMTTHALHHHFESDPQKAAEILVSRATRKMVCFGAKPVAISAMLYHINYSDPNGQYIASGAKVGLENATRSFDLKLSDKKIRFDYFGEHGFQSPTMIVSILGTVPSNREKLSELISPNFKGKGNNIYLIGKLSDDISSSEYLEFFHEVSESPLPEFDLEFEVQLVEILKQLIDHKLINSALPIAKGGLFFSLLRAGWKNELGFDITTAAETRIDSFLFGESMGRILVTVSQEQEDEFVDYMFETKIPFFTLGHVTKGEIRIDDESFGYIDKMSVSL